MERNREVGSRGSMARRRHRITSLQDSPDGRRLLLNENKRRRVGRRFVEKRCSRDEEEEGGGGDVDSTEESFDNVEEEEDDRKILRNRASSSSSSVSNHGHRQNITPARGAVRSSSVMRITDEMVIGVPVPRKARSASTKRSHEEQSHRKYTPSPVTFGGNRDGTSPSSSSGSLRNKKMKSLGIKTRLRLSNRSMKSSEPIQDDIEIEVAEALFDLMKQSQSHSQLESESSMKQERSNDVNKAADDKSICSPLNIVGASAKDVANGKEAASVQNGLVTEKKINNEEKMGIERCLMKSENVLSKIIMAERIESKKEERARKEKDSNEVPVGGDMVAIKEEFVAPKEEESQPCAKPIADSPVGLASSKPDLTAEVTEEKREETFEIDLMAPSLPSSPEWDGLTHMASDHPQVVIQDAQMKSEVVVKTEDKLVGKGQEEKKIEISYSKRGSSKLDLKMPYQENVGISSQQEGKKEPSQCEASIPGGQKFAPLSSFPFPIAGSGWPTCLPNSGCMPTLQIAMPVDRSARSVIALQRPPFSLSKPRPKRCTTHQYIARNIQFHQQLIEKSMQPPAAAATVEGAKPHNLKPSLLGQNVIGGSTSSGDFPGCQTLTKVSGLSGTDKNSGTSNNVDSTNGKQLMLQQGPQQTPIANMLHGQALIFQLGQHNASKAPINQSGPLKSASAFGNGSMPSDSSGGAPGNSSACPAGTAAVSFNHANFSSNAAPPYMAIFPNNGYPFSFSANVGGPPLNKGGSQAPIMTFHNGSYYSSPMFQIPQSQTKQPHSQPQVHTSSHDTSTSNGSSSSQVQPHNKPQIGAQISPNTFFPPMSMLLQQPEKQRAPSSHSAGKPAAETSQKNVLVADSHASHFQKSNNNQNFVVPIQPINLSYVTPGTLRGKIMSSNHSEQQQQGTKGGLQLMPPQAFELSFSSTASTAAALNFSSMAQHPAVFQMLPDMGRQVYPLAPGTQMTQQKNFQMSEGKILVGSISNVEDRKGISGKFPVTAGQSLNGSKSSGIEPSTSTLMGAAVFDSSGRTLSFVQLPVSGSQTFPSSSTLPMAVVSANTANSQHQHHQQLHFQKRNQQMQPTGTTKFKDPISNAFPCAFITTDSPNNYPLFSQTLVQTSSSAQSSNLNCLYSSQVSSFNASSLKDIQQQQLKNPKSQTHIAFGNPSNTATTFQGQNIFINSHSAAPLVGGSPATCSMSNGTGGNVKTAPTSSKSGPTSASSPSQQIEASQSTPSQKSSPVCGRNVPSILSTSPSQLSELY